MDWSIEIKIDGDILVAVVGGDLYESDYRAARDKIRSYIEAKDIYRVLFDIRNAVLRVSTMDIFSIAASNPEVIPVGTLYAVVYSLKTISVSDAVFGENVARNRGACLKIFTEIEKAKRWLMAQSNKAPDNNRQK